MIPALFNHIGAACAVALFTGCASLPKIRLSRYGAATAAAVAPLPAPAIGSGIPVPNEFVATPGVRKAYYVGPMIDPAHPELMYRPGIVYRQEVPERWNRNPTAWRGAVSGVIAAVPDPAILPPASAEMEQLVAQQRRVMQLLSESNVDLRRRVEAVNPETEKPAPESAASTVTKQGAVPPAGPVTALTTTLPAARASVDLSRALVPNADGAIELSAEILDPVDRSEPNPFVKRYQSQTTFRDLLVTVTGTSLGPRPTASVNGRLLNIGDAWEGFTVAAIARDAVSFQKEVYLLQIPLARASGVTVRLLQ
jgi:hypothetical protein